MDASKLPESLISPDAYPDFLEWARDGGYDESWFNRWDSKSRELEARYLEEAEEARRLAACLSRGTAR